MFDRWSSGRWPGCEGCSSPHLCSPDEKFLLLFTALLLLLILLLGGLVFYICSICAFPSCVCGPINAGIRGKLTKGLPAWRVPWSRAAARVLKKPWLF